MNEFVFGTQDFFMDLDQMLSDGLCHVYHDCVLPPNCSPQTTRMGFEKEPDRYILYVDTGIVTDVDCPEFVQLLRKGDTRFVCLEDMVSFFHGLQPLFSDSVHEHRHADENPSQTVHNGNTQHANEGSVTPAGDDEPAVDKEKLREIRAQAATPKTVWPEEIAQRLKKEIFGQDEVIDALSKKIVINRMRQDKKLLTVGLLGPTGTGKSETGKSLASVLTDVYGTPFGFIDIKANQMVGEHSVNSFFGAPPGYVGHGNPTLLDPVKKNPDHVIVIEEIEKANQTVLTGLMEAIDTGILDQADNSPAIDLNRCIMLFTSNIPVNMREYRDASAFMRGEICRDAFTKHCNKPEISGKIGNFLVFDTLPDEARADIITKFIRQELRSYELQLKTVDPYLMNDFISHETKYGARPLMALVSDAIGEQLLTKPMMEALKGKRVSMRGTMDRIVFDVATEGSYGSNEKNY